MENRSQNQRHVDVAIALTVQNILLLDIPKAQAVSPCLQGEDLGQKYQFQFPNDGDSFRAPQTNVKSLEFSAIHPTCSHLLGYQHHHAPCVVLQTSHPRLTVDAQNLDKSKRVAN